MLENIKLFAILFFISMAFIFALQKKGGNPIIIPGDIYIRKNQKYIYIPISSTFLLTLIIYIILSSLKRKFGLY